MGGPSSGHHDRIISELHNDKVFKGTSQSPSKTFDEIRGASPQINSYNNIVQFMPTLKERPRLTVLQNFKEISRIMTNTFIKNKQLESKYNTRIPADVLANKEMEDQATENMVRQMRMMISPRNFIGTVKRAG